MHTSARESMVIDNSPIARAPVWRLIDGEPICVPPDEEDPELRERKIVPPQSSYTLRIIGIGVPQTEPNQFYKPDDPKSRPDRTSAWWEFEIVQGRNLTSRFFSNKWTWSLNEKATMGKFVQAMLQADPPKGKWDVLELLGREFEAVVKPKSDTYAELLVDTVMPKPVDRGDLSTPEQRQAIWAAAVQTWRPDSLAKRKLVVFLRECYSVETTDDLTLDQADEVLAFFAKEKPEAIKQLVEDAEMKLTPEVPV